MEVCVIEGQEHHKSVVGNYWSSCLRNPYGGADSEVVISIGLECQVPQDVLLDALDPKHMGLKSQTSEFY